MAQTITEKILAAHCGREEVEAGEFIEGKIDLCLGNDITAPIAIREFKGLGVEKVFDRTKVALIPDHFTPNKDIKSAEQARILRDFAREQDLEHYWEIGECGVEHALLPEQGVVTSGDLVIGADSHTCTYGALGAFSTGVGSTDLAACMATGEVWLRVPETMKFVFSGERRKYVGGKDFILYTIGQIGVDGALYRAMEFCGDAVDALPMDDRLSMCNMAIEAGGKNGIIAPDAITAEYEAGRAKREPRIYASDPGAEYHSVHEYDAGQIELQVALPHLPSNSKPVGEVAGMKLDQVVIGSCTNGRVSDFEIAYQIMKGNKVAKGLRVIMIPATQAIWLEANRNGWLSAFVEAGAVVSTPTCGPCLGGHMGILAKGERCLATTNRNFVGRMGHPESEVLLSGPAVAAASALTGVVTDPVAVS
jgi:3-isopropylmalate/(R)-2-methylmalate dehydratase large subunit